MCVPSRTGFEPPAALQCTFGPALGAAAGAAVGVAVPVPEASGAGLAVFAVEDESGAAVPSPVDVASGVGRAAALAERLGAEAVPDGGSAQPTDAHTARSTHAPRPTVHRIAAS
jgi:hypothetical protein